MSGPAGVAEVAGSGLSPREIELIRSAYRVIARQGGHRLSLQDIADEAGVSKGLILYHFKSKDRLLLTTMRYALLRTAQRIRERLEDLAAPEEAIPALLEAVFISPERNRDFYLLYLDLAEYAARDANFNELSTLTEQIVNGLYAEVIRQGVDRGVLDVGDIDDAAAQMRALIDGTFIVWVQREDWKHSHEQYKERCREGVLRLLGASAG